MLRFFEFELLPSTSSKVTELIAEEKCDLPFVVTAKQQAAGKGRLGRSWLSPPGNIYFTLALDASEICEVVDLPIPLRVATIIAQELQHRFGIRLTIKWPNDLLFSTAKIAGILCEATSDSKQNQIISIGVGININNCPQVSDQNTICLKDILHGTQTIQPDIEICDLAFELAQAIYGRLKESMAPIMYQNFAIQNGHLWCDNHSVYYQNTGLNAQGGFCLSQLSKLATPLSLHSADHHLSWVYQKKPKSPLLIADAGNSKLKIALFQNASDHNPEQVYTIDFETADRLLEALESISLSLLVEKRWPIFLGCVNDKGVQKIKGDIEHAGFQLVALEKRSVLVDFSRYQMSQLGIDRLALCEGAMIHFDNAPLLIISAGTCLTIEFIDGRRVYQGGWILPGLHMKLKALSDYTDALPLIQSPKWPKRDQYLSPFGLDTKSSITHAVFYETIFALSQLKQTIMAGCKRPPKVLITGGDGALLSEHIEGEYDPYLVLRGLKSLTLGGLCPRDCGINVEAK